MKNTKNLAALLASVFLAAGCGGGSGSGTTAGQSDNSWLQLTPSTADLTVVEGMPQKFTVTAKSGKTIPQTFNVGIVDNAGLIDPAVEVSARSPLEYSATMKVSSTLKAGSYSTRLEVRLCEDDPKICAKPIKGSPWFVPLNVAVKSATNLTPLTDLPNVGTWQGIGGSIAHTAYVSGTFDPAKFSTRFLRPLTDARRALVGDLTIENGVVYMSEGDIKYPQVIAFDEATNAQKWSSSFSLPDNLTTAPAIVGGQLYVGKQYQAYSGNLKRLTITTGVWDGNTINVGNDPDWIQVQSGGLLSSGKDTIKRINLITSQAEWTAKLPFTPSSVPTADADNIYVFTQANLGIYRANDGTVVAAPFSTSNQCMTSAVHATDGKGLLYGVCYIANALDPSSGYSPDVGSELHVIDTLSKARKWSVNGPYKPSVALGGTTLYALNAGVLEAHNASDGKLLWSSNLLTGPDGLREAETVLATDNLIFVSSKGPTASEAGKTVAVDLATHKVVWSYPHGGKMAVSSKGVLYIGGNNFKSLETEGITPFIAAINLR